MESNDIESTVTRIETLATAAGAAYDASCEATAAETAAEAELLTRVIAAAKPGLRAISKRVKVSTSIAHTYAEPECEYLPDVRAFCLSDRKGARPGRQQGPNDTRGSYGGADLLVTTDGRFLELDYSGEWSNWQGEGEAWKAEVREISALDVASDWTISHMIATLAEALESYKPEAQTAKSRERAERLAALAKLI